MTRAWIQQNDTPMDIRHLFTGSYGTPAAANAFIEAAAGTRLPANQLPVGRALEIPFQTSWTLISARTGSAEQLAQALQQIAGAHLLTAEADSGGEIFVPAELASAKTGQGEAQCQAGDPQVYPFVPSAVSGAYRLSLESWQAMGFARQTIHLVVVDNGFFGVPCRPGNCPQLQAGRLVFAERFPRQYFDASQFSLGRIGPMTQHNIFPINYSNGLTRADAVTGHGTHVAGLALGGPAFLSERAVFNADGGSWIKIVVANLAPGRRTFQPESRRRSSIRSPASRAGVSSI